MGSTSILAAVFFSITLLVICGAVLLLIRYYVPLRSTPSYITLPVFLAIALPASIVLLVPIDLASRAEEDDGDLRGIWLPERVILVSWRILYWLTFVLTWAILPLIGEYADAGYREPKEKLLYSLRSNGFYWSIYLGFGTLGAIYWFLSVGFDFYNLKALVVALAYAWGLTMAIYLMGHGLIALPRRLFRNASVSSRLRIIQSRAPGIHDRLMDALDEVEQLEHQVTQLQLKKTTTSRASQEWIQDLADGISLLESRTPSRSTTSIPPVITERYLADITRKLKRARHAKIRFLSEWDNLVREAENTQAILDSASSRRLEYPNPDPHNLLSRTKVLTPYSRYVLQVHIMPILYYALGGLLSLAAVMVIWSSIVKSLEKKLSLIGWSVIHHKADSSRNQIGLAGQIIAAAWIFYMVAAALYSVTEVKIWGNRALVRRGTYQESATWYASQLAKLSVPLSYNFITFLPGSIYQNTMFHRFLGKLIVLTPLGDAFQAYFPMLILIPVIFTIFGVYKKVKNVVGFGDGVMEDEDEGAAEGGASSTWREGRALIDRELHGAAAPEGSNALALSQRNHQDRVIGLYRDGPDASETSATMARSRLERASRQARMREEEEEGGGFFDDLGWRIRNTFDGMERPRWMGGTAGDDDSRIASNTNSTRVGQGQGGLRRWFGGGDEGRVRL